LLRFERVHELLRKREVSIDWSSQYIIHNAMPVHFLIAPCLMESVKNRIMRFETERREILY
jgi:hypothetical protein